MEQAARRVSILDGISVTKKYTEFAALIA